MGRWLLVLVASAWIVAASFTATAADGGQPPDTNVLCASKCGTCPTVCSSVPPPPSSSSSDAGSSGPPSKPGGGSGSSSPLSPSRSTSPPGQGQSKGGHPSSYYYFFTSGSGRRSDGPTGFATVLVVAAVSLAAAGFL